MGITDLLLPDVAVAGALMACLAAISLASLASLAISRLYFSPLANVPGPWLAAVTGWYEFYYDCILAGQYVFEIERMHDKYGPIVRISPREVHIKDPDYFNELYAVTNKLDKDHFYYRFVASSDAAFGTASADVHRVRRKAMSRFFSQSAISGLEESVVKCVAKLCDKLAEHRQKGVPVNLSNAHRCLAADVVSEYCLPRSYHFLDFENFAESYNEQARVLSNVGYWHRHLPFVIPLFMATPRWVVAKTATKGGLQMFDFQNDLKAQSSEAVSAEKVSLDEGGRPRTVLHGICNSPDLPATDKTVDRLLQEARTLIGAGSETTGNTLDVIVFQVLSDPSVLRKLKDELQQAAAADRPPTAITPLGTLKQLPYLTAVVTEGLRLATSVAGRLPRLNPTTPTQYKSCTLAPGTVISMTIRDIHFDPTIYPDPYAFRPERWLSSSASGTGTGTGSTGSTGPLLDRYFIPFGRGSRSCVGKDLATSELYLALGNVLRQFDLELYQTTESDVRMAHDFFSPFPPKDSKGLRVVVK